MAKSSHRFTADGEWPQTHLFLYVAEIWNLNMFFSFNCYFSLHINPCCVSRMLWITCFSSCFVLTLSHPCLCVCVSPSRNVHLGCVLIQGLYFSNWTPRVFLEAICVFVWLYVFCCVSVSVVPPQLLTSTAFCRDPVPTPYFLRCGENVPTTSR